MRKQAQAALQQLQPSQAPLHDSPALQTIPAHGKDSVSVQTALCSNCSQYINPCETLVANQGDEYWGCCTLKLGFADKRDGDRNCEPFSGTKYHYGWNHLWQ